MSVYHRRVHKQAHAQTTANAVGIGKTDRQSRLQSQDAIAEARWAGLDWRSISVPLPAVTANGTTTVGVWVPGWMSWVRAIDVVYLTPPSSAAGSIVLDVKKVMQGTTTLIQDAAAFDLEALAAGTSSRVTTEALAKTDRTLMKGAYVYAEITSDNADAVDGVGGVLVLHYKMCK